MTLTPREREVMSLAIKGKRDKEIAAELNISPKTVGTHMQNLYRRFDVCTRIALMNKVQRMLMEESC